MKAPKWVSALFAATALYDTLLGLLFLAAPEFFYKLGAVTVPNHWGYVQFPGAILLIFALMFLRVSLSPLRHRDLMFYGILLKVAFVAVAGGHWINGGLPMMWKPFVLIDAVTGLAFVAAYLVTGVESVINE